MSMVSCGNGHFYNDEEHSNCPYCGVGLEINPTRPLPINELSRPELKKNDGYTRKLGEQQPKHTPVRDPDVTRHVWAKRMGSVDPVVGWLVCIAGPERGRDYRLHTERNFIGRDPSMDVAITSDQSISRINHAVISYNPKRHTFRLAPGDSRGLAYLNDEEVIAPVALAPYDRIELGETALLFIPFCGECFVWLVEETPRDAAPKS